MEFTATTVYTYEKLLKFNNTLQQRKILMWVLLGIVNLLMIGTVTLSFALVGFDSRLFFYMLAIVFITLLYVFLVLILPRFTYKKSPALGAVCTFVFTEESITTTAKSNSMDESSTFRYHVFKKTIEDAECIYLFISSSQAYIIEKSSLSGGTSSAFKAFLSEKNPSIKHK